MRSPTTLSDTAIDVDTASFEKYVLEESRRRPVIVDFWAEWCGPCRTLGPVLEKLAAESAGKMLLARVDVDANPELSSRYRVQGIPAVKAFRDGQVISEFVGALPEAEVRRFLESIVPGPADEAAKRGEEKLAAGDAAGARAEYDAALAVKPRHPRALLGLARIDLSEGKRDDAQRRLDLLGPAADEGLAADAGALRLLLRGGGATLDALRERVRADPEDDAARVELGLALAAAGEAEQGLEELLHVVKRHHREGPGEEARKAMLDTFEAVGARSELADRYRAMLAAELYR